MCSEQKELSSYRDGMSIFWRVREFEVKIRISSIALRQYSLSMNKKCFVLKYGSRSTDNRKPSNFIFIPLKVKDFRAIKLNVSQI